MMKGINNMIILDFIRIEESFVENIFTITDKMSSFLMHAKSTVVLSLVMT